MTTQKQKTPEEIVEHIVSVFSIAYRKHRLGRFSDQAFDFGPDYESRIDAAFEEINRSLEWDFIDDRMNQPFTQFTRFGQFRILRRSSLDDGKAEIVFENSETDLPYRALFRNLNGTAWQILEVRWTCLCCFNDDLMRPNCDCCQGTGWCL